MNEIGKKWQILWYLLFLANLCFALYIWYESAIVSTDVVPNPYILTATVLIAGYLTKRHKFMMTPQKTSWLGLTGLCAVSAAISFLSIISSANVWLLELYIALAAFYVLAIDGFDRLKVLAPLFVLSIFLLPNLQQFWRDLLSLPLQYLGTALTVMICHFFIPIRQAGHFFLINHDSYDVAPSCTGLGMLSSFMFGFAIWQTFMKTRPMAYLLVPFFDPLLALMLNTVRLVITAFCGYLVSKPFALSIHSNLEYGLVPLGFFIMWLLGRKYELIET